MTPARLARGGIVPVMKYRERRRSEPDRLFFRRRTVLPMLTVAAVLYCQGALGSADVVVAISAEYIGRPGAIRTA